MSKRRYAGTLNGKKGSSLALEAQFKDVIERVEYLCRLGELEVAEAIRTGEPMPRLKLDTEDWVRTPDGQEMLSELFHDTEVRS